MKFLVRILAVGLLSGSALSAFANGTWHGAYIGKGIAKASCGDKDLGSEKFISTMDRAGYDGGTYFYYGLRFTETDKIVSYDFTMSRSWKAVIGDAGGIANGIYRSYEDCPGRDICEGQCCDVEDGNDSAARLHEGLPNVPLTAVSSSSNNKTYPTKTEVELKLTDGKKVYLTYIEENKRRAAINLEGKMVNTNGCELTWKDNLVWKDEKPDAVKETLHCIGGKCRWKSP